MVTFVIKINPTQRTAYFPKVLVDTLGYSLKMIPNERVAIVASEDEDLVSIVKHVRLLLRMLESHEARAVQQTSEGDLEN